MLLTENPWQLWLHTPAKGQSNMRLSQKLEPRFISRFINMFPSRLPLIEVSWYPPFSDTAKDHVVGCIYQIISYHILSYHHIHIYIYNLMPSMTPLMAALIPHS